MVVKCCLQFFYVIVFACLKAGGPKSPLRVSPEAPRRRPKARLRKKVSVKVPETIFGPPEEQVGRRDCFVQEQLIIPEACGCTGARIRRFILGNVQHVGSIARPKCMELCAWF